MTIRRARNKPYGSDGVFDVIFAVIFFFSVLATFAFTGVLIWGIIELVQWVTAK